MEELSRTVERLTREHLSIVVKVLATDNHGEDYVKHGLATEVLRFFFGNKWTNENAFDVHKQVERYHRDGRKFLRTEAEDEENAFLHQQRVLELAEYVFNLQHVEGLRERIARMDRDDLESAFGEIDCASLLAAPSLKFRFIKPTGKKGSDYEGEVTAPGGRIICCEIKTKSEHTPLTLETLPATIETARKQLPKERPGLVIIKIPMSWPRESTLVEIVESSIRDAFRASQRIVAIVFTWDEYSVVNNGRLFAKKVRDYVNERSSLFKPDILELIQAMGRAHNPEWIQFHQFVESQLKEMHQ